MRKPPKFQLTYYLQDIVHKEKEKNPEQVFLLSLLLCLIFIQKP